MQAELLLATRPLRTDSNGLATFVLEVPLYVWVELLTHKRPARNASSSRAQSYKRHSAMGYYTPPVFYSQGEFMRAGEPLPEEVQAELLEFWTLLHQDIYERIDAKLGSLKARGYTWAKEQVNRLLPTTKLVRGVMTATEDAWGKVFALRNHPDADRTMQEVAAGMQAELERAYWWRADYHIPFDDNPRAPRDYEEFDARAKVSAARLARVSNGQPGPGQRPDEVLASDLLRDQHFSPFEHIARWVSYPLTSALAVKAEDFYSDNEGIWGWENYRSELEEEAAFATATDCT